MIRPALPVLVEFSNVALPAIEALTDEAEVLRLIGIGVWPCIFTTDLMVDATYDDTLETKCGVDKARFDVNNKIRYPKSKLGFQAKYVSHLICCARYVASTHALPSGGACSDCTGSPLIHTVCQVLDASDCTKRPRQNVAKSE
ncbi:Uncharacterized protein PBTT_06388 [Plasmodiophora brassicae]